MKTQEVKYFYDPANQRLTIKVDGKLVGGFVGKSAEDQLASLIERGKQVHLSDNTESIRRAKIRQIRAIWNKLGIDHYREAILSEYGVSSTADLTIPQLNELLIRFDPDKNKPGDQQIRKYRSDILTILNKLGIYATDGDWKPVNDYLMQPRIAGKMLFQLTTDELVVLRRKLNNILDKQEIIKIDNDRVKDWN